jgi:hypothetical protein
MGFVVYRQGLGLVVRDEGYAAEGRRKGGGEGGDGAERWARRGEGLEGKLGEGERDEGLSTNGGVHVDPKGDDTWLL